MSPDSPPAVAWGALTAAAESAVDDAIDERLRALEQLLPTSNVANEELQQRLETLERQRDDSVASAGEAAAAAAASTAALQQKVEELSQQLVAARLEREEQTALAAAADLRAFEYGTRASPRKQQQQVVVQQEAAAPQGGVDVEAERKICIEARGILHLASSISKFTRENQTVTHNELESYLSVRLLPTKPYRTRLGDKEWRNGRRAPTQDPSTNDR